VNIEQALELGFDDDVAIPPSAPDAFGSNEYAWIVSVRSRDVLEAVTPGAIHYYSFAHTDQFFVACPARLGYVPENPVIGSPNPTAPRPEVDYVVTGKRCAKCGRYRTMTFRSRYFNPPDDAAIVGAVAEQGTIPSMHWSATAEVADAIEQAKLTGWWIQRDCC
jgi:hypothetical protein